MKGFSRANLAFSLCGLHCGLCPMRIDGHCPGCGGGAGNQSCAIAKCSLQHNNVEYCFLCSEYPCQKYNGIEEYDSFITHQRQLRDITRALEMGMELYNGEQTQKAEILQTLLANYNDGYRKTFYCVAVNLLPLQDIKNAMQQMAEDSSFGTFTGKEKAEYVVSLFRQIADQQGLVLKLHKKPAKK